ncbi:MAG: SDR family NAD(P)-dependent oxidoreductase [Arenicella sp.]
MTSIDNGIAIIGMHLRFPGANDTEQYWRNLRDGVESITRFDRDELLQSGVDRSVLDGDRYVPASAVIDDIDLFDANFFDMPPAEAEILDPQQRVFLELAWQALERAGHDPQRPAGLIGVFAGGAANTYAAACHLIPPGGPTHITDVYDVLMGNDKDFLPTRVSYKLNLRGPSVNVQTACSTSLVATHLACQSLLAGECDVALAGGVSIMVPQRTGYTHREGMILSADGHCRPFDAQADGIVGGHGAGVVVLRRLEDALEDGDTIRAVIRGSAINNDGGAKAGFTAPSIDGQSDVIAEALAVAGVPAQSISYVEAHGTGTAIGDPIEIQALAEAYSNESSQKCVIGSVKSNIGHLNTASGIAGLIKTVLALEHGEIPGTLHYQSPNPRIDFAKTPFVVSGQTKPWTLSSDYPRRAGVSSFGIGGSNAHMIVEEAPVAVVSEPQQKSADKPQLLLLSARDSETVAQMSINLGTHLKEKPDTDLGHTAYTLANGRAEFSHRRYLVANSTGEAADALCREQGKAIDGGEVLVDPKVAFLFAGQGSQFLEMGRALYNNESVFRRNIDECCEILCPVLGHDLRSLMYPTQPNEQSADRLRRTEYAQPALFVLGHSLATLWESWGVTAHAALGHSIGEYVAACLAGVFSREDALMLVAARAQLMQSMPAGAMLSVNLNENAVQKWTNTDVALAAVNSPNNCVLSGTESAIIHVEEQLRADGIQCINFDTSHGFHSHLCDTIIEPFTEQVALFRPAQPKTRFISNVTGDWITDEQACSPAYWAQHLRQTVRFSQGVDTLVSSGHRMLVELSPGVTLGPIVRQQKDSEHCRIVSGLPHRQSKVDPLHHGLSSLGAVWASGVDIQPFGDSVGSNQKRIELPTYPFQRRRYWAKLGEQQRAEQTAEPVTQTVQPRQEIDHWFYTRQWQRIRPNLTNTNSVNQETWLVFVDQAGVGKAIVTELKRAGQHVIQIHNSDGINSSDDLINVDLTRGDATEILFEQLQETLPNNSINVVYAWSNIPDIAPETHLHFVMQLAARMAHYAEAKFLFATQGVFDVVGNERLCPRQAILCGAAIVLPQEFPQLHVTHIDLDADAVVTGLFWHKVISVESAVVAIRGNTVWLPQHQSIELTEDAPIRVREQGVYLLTGGLGGIASVICEAIARRHKGTRFALISRTASADDSRVEALQQTLTGLGAYLKVYTADVCDAVAMSRVVQQTTDDFGSDIHGVVHCAGVIDATPMMSKSREQIADVLSAKVRGTEVLDQVFDSIQLDFMVYCSSLASVIGAFGMADYCAANAFLDCHAAERAKRKHGQTLSVGWDGWRDIGMSGARVDSQYQHHAPTQGIAAHEGGAAFLRMLSTPYDHVMVSTSDLNTRNMNRPDIQSSEPANPREKHPRPNLVNPYIPASSELEKRIASILADVLGIEQVGLHDNFFELGATSFSLVKVHTKLSAGLEDSGSPLAVSELFEHSNVASLAQRIDGEQVAVNDLINEARKRAKRQRDALASSNRVAIKRRK